ncbi:hypothetical protein NWP22_06590 [Anabaenopsis tanganyikae CS-531]|uniref:Transposase n=1 Tax=Anabaenopsis tanganyikae CS-531 TaxID=2785304 RepID=A0ABT6KCL0_9CYAN|nr:MULTISPECIES: hypothetical protein [Nostocales]MDB9447361.1 hypothetical protein [Anabaena sp. CS-542/02]MDH6099516.1 hypothetical protein [Anabaenopsis sp. FSS-46]MDH6105535.1 hypothetical protein [Anabaenopsis tanganyikae CS-531]
MGAVIPGVDLHALARRDCVPIKFLKKTTTIIAWFSRRQQSQFNT